MLPDLEMHEKILESENVHSILLKRPDLEDFAQNSLNYMIPKPSKTKSFLAKTIVESLATLTYSLWRNKHFDGKIDQISAISNNDSRLLIGNHASTTEYLFGMAISHHLKFKRPKVFVGTNLMTNPIAKFLFAENGSIGIDRRIFEDKKRENRVQSILYGKLLSEVVLALTKQRNDFQFYPESGLSRSGVLDYKAVKTGLLRLFIDAQKKVDHEIFLIPYSQTFERNPEDIRLSYEMSHKKKTDPGTISKLPHMIPDVIVSPIWVYYGTPVSLRDIISENPKDAVGGAARYFISQVLNGIYATPTNVMALAIRDKSSVLRRELNLDVQRVMDLVMDLDVLVAHEWMKDNPKRIVDSVLISGALEHGLYYQDHQINVFNPDLIAYHSNTLDSRLLIKS